MNEILKRYPALHFILATYFVANNIWVFNSYTVPYFVPIICLAFGTYGVIYNVLHRRSQLRAIAEAHAANVEQWQEDLVLHQPNPTKGIPVPMTQLGVSCEQRSK